jgi:hypothetical protein
MFVSRRPAARESALAARHVPPTRGNAGGHPVCGLRLVCPLSPTGSRSSGRHGTSTQPQPASEAARVRAYAMPSVTPPQVPNDDGRGPRRPTPSHGPASPRCPTWAERLKVPVWIDDGSANFSAFDRTQSHKSGTSYPQVSPKTRKALARGEARNLPSEAFDAQNGRCRSVHNAGTVGNLVAPFE